jgi:hypothetical protein
MQLAKEKVVEFIRARGDDHNAERAEQELPETLELPGDEGVVAQYGVTADDLDDASVWGT